MDFEQIVNHNKEIKRLKQDKCSHKDKEDFRIIFQKCKCCGKLVPVADEEYLEKTGLQGKAPELE